MFHFYTVNLLSVTNSAHDSTVLIFGFESVFTYGKVMIYFALSKGYLAHMQKTLFSYSDGWFSNNGV